MGPPRPPPAPITFPALGKLKWKEERAPPRVGPELAGPASPAGGRGDTEQLGPHCFPPPDRLRFLSLFEEPVLGRAVTFLLRGQGFGGQHVSLFTVKGELKPEGKEDE